MNDIVWYLKYQVELIWDREFHFTPFGEPSTTLKAAIANATHTANSGDGALVKETRVTDSEGNVVWAYGRIVPEAYDALAAELGRLKEVYATTVDCWKADGARLADVERQLKIQVGVNEIAYVPHRALTEQNDALRARLAEAERRAKRNGAVLAHAMALISRMDTPAAAAALAEINAAISAPDEALFGAADQPAAVTYESRHMGVIDCMNRDELDAYDQGSGEAMAAVKAILDGEDDGRGVSNEPWESIRRRLIALVASDKPGEVLS